MRLAAVNPIPGLFTIAPADRDHEVGLRAGVTVLVALLVLLATHRMDLAVLAAATLAGRRHRIVWPDPVLHDDGARRLILWEAAWYVVAAGVAGVVATLLAAPAGVHHNYWAMVDAVVPLVGHSTRYRVSRGLQRVIGTFLGLALTAGSILLDPPVIVLVLIIAVLQVAAELYIARQYVIAQTVVTPLALLSTMLVGVTAGGAGSLMAAEGLQHLADRGVETVIGAAVGIVCVLSPWAWRRWV